MKILRIVGLFVFVLTLCVSSHAQTRFLVGTEGAVSFDNDSLGVFGAVEVPFAKHYELDLRDTFSPLEDHVGLGHGKANIARASGIVWLTPGFGITGSTEYSTYDVTKVAKGAIYSFGGPIWRKVLWGAPARFELDYIRQVGNGIKSGIETSHLQGVAIGYDVRMGCELNFCVRLSEQFALGRVLTQGNPVCDGSQTIAKGVSPCPRSSALGESFEATVSLEFPRRRGHENDVF